MNLVIAGMHSRVLPLERVTYRMSFAGSHNRGLSLCTVLVLGNLRACKKGNYRVTQKRCVTKKLSYSGIDCIATYDKYQLQIIHFMEDHPSESQLFLLNFCFPNICYEYSPFRWKQTSLTKFSISFHPRDFHQIQCIYRGNPRTIEDLKTAITGNPEKRSLTKWWTNMTDGTGLMATKWWKFEKVS